MKPITLETLRRILEEFPTLPWPVQALEELVAPRHGVITSFSEFLRETAQLSTLDLDVTGPAGTIEPPRETA